VKGGVGKEVDKDSNLVYGGAYEIVAHITEVGGFGKVFFVYMPWGLSGKIGGKKGGGGI